MAGKKKKKKMNKLTHAQSALVLKAVKKAKGNLGTDKAVAKDLTKTLKFKVVPSNVGRIRRALGIRKKAGGRKVVAKKASRKKVGKKKATRKKVVHKAKNLGLLPLISRIADAQEKLNGKLDAIGEYLGIKL